MNKVTQAVSSDIVFKGGRGEGRRIVSGFFFFFLGWTRISCM